MTPTIARSIRSRLITTSNLLDVPARILMALIFMIAGLGKLGAPADTIAYMRFFGVPGVLLYPTIAFEIGGGLLLVLGLQTRAIAFLLAGFTIVSAWIFHLEPGDQTQSIMFLKNLAIAGGLLLLAKHGTGTLSVDTVLANRGAGSAAVNDN